MRVTYSKTFQKTALMTLLLSVVLSAAGAQESMCEQGKNQSPIDLSSFIEAELPDPTFAYGDGVKNIANQDSALVVNYSNGGAMSIGGVDYTLQQIAFRTPGEHQVESHEFPAEAQFIHKDAEGNVAIVSVMYQLGEDNAQLAPVLDAAPSEVGEASLEGGLSPMSLFPDEMGYYLYNGSLTTAPCSEGVRWLVMQQPNNISAAQVDKLQALVGGANNRALQAKNARVILQ